MNIERLHQLFEENPEKTSLGWSGQCADCGCEAAVVAKLTDEGIEISGGSVYEIQPNTFLIKCSTCFEKKPVLSNYQDCEVYSRVVGYLRPVQQYNDGKKEEFKDRAMFDRTACSL